MNDDGLGEAETSLIEFAQRVSLGAKLIEQTDKLLFVQVTHFQPQHNFSCNHVVGTGFGPDPSHGTDLPAGHARDHLIHLLDEARGGKQGIVPLVHGRGAGMVGKTLDGDLTFKNAHDPFHYADIDFLLLQAAALLDVQFEISGDTARLAPRRGKLIKISADKACAVANCLAALRYPIKLPSLQAFSQGLAADSATFFIREDDNFERMAQRNLLFFQNLRNFNRGKRAHVAVIVPAHGNGIDVRAGQNRLKRRIAARPSADNVPRRIDVDFEPGIFHQADGVFAALQISLGVGNPAYPTLWIRTEL